MKKKRSVIKPDVAPSTVATKPIDGFREAKQGVQSRLHSDARSRLNDTYGFRYYNLLSKLLTRFKQSIYLSLLSFSPVDVIL